MAIPVMDFVDGQGGHVQLNGVILQPTMYRIHKQFINANATTTGSGGNRQRVRVMRDWGFEAHFFFDNDHIPGGIRLVNGVYVAQGIEADVDGQGNSGVPCIFQIGASGYQYQGIALLASNSPGLVAEGLVDLMISGEAARGPLVGPVAGRIS